MDIFKFFKKNQQTNQNIFFKSSTTKHSMNSSCTLKFSTETEKKKKEINEKLKVLIKKYINNPEKLMQYMQLKGLKVYKFRNADKILKKFGEEAGFITPLKGIKAVCLNLIIGLLYESKLKFGITTKEMFIFNIDNTEIYTIARALHKYYGYKHNLPGFDYQSQEIFKKVYGNRNHTAVLNDSSIRDLYACKEALARDLESINFTIELSVEYENSKKALEKIKQTDSASI